MAIETCGECGGKGVRIVYGLLGPELADAAERGDLRAWRMRHRGRRPKSSMPRVRERMAHRVCFRHTSVTTSARSSPPHSSGPEVPHRAGVRGSPSQERQGMS